MGITNVNKQINVDTIACDGTLTVTLALSASPDIATNPTDIVLLLDRSGSMSGQPLASLKQGANVFIDIIDEATDGMKDGMIGNGSRIGIVSFSDVAVADTQLITSVADLKDAVDALNAGGSTNHADAFTKGIQLFDPSSSNAKVMVMFTDGKTTSGALPAPVAVAARAQGIIIYCIGLVGDDGIDIAVLNDWASDPDASHVAITPDDADLETLFANLAANISKTGATNIMIDEIVSSAFKIINIDTPSIGTAIMQSDQELLWKIDALGVNKNEGASLSFQIQHIGTTGGDTLVNQWIGYSDNEGNKVVFPEPSVYVDCDIVVEPEPCPVPIDMSVEGCQDMLVMDLGNVYLESLGRIIELNLTLKHVCPKKRVALAVILSEVDDLGNEYPRGMKTMTIPAHDGKQCKDILVKCIRFVLPEDLDVQGSQGRCMCGKRNLKARVIAHNIDTDYQCCGKKII